MQGGEIMGEGYKVIIFMWIPMLIMLIALLSLVGYSESRHKKALKKSANFKRAINTPKGI